MTNIISLADRHRARLHQACQQPDIEALLKIRDDLALLHSILQQELAQMSDITPISSCGTDPK